MIRFACPNCRKVLTAPPDKGGMKAACPACKQVVSVPAAAAPAPDPAARPSPPPIPLPPPTYPLRPEPVGQECHGWEEFASAMRGEDDGGRPLDLSGPVLSEIRKRLDGYAASVPHHSAAGFGTKATITSAAEWCVYAVSLQAVFETRRLGHGEAPHSGWRLPATPADPATLDVWDFRYRPHPGLAGRSEHVLTGTQAVHSCEPCRGGGDVTCGTCDGKRVVACPSCRGGGTEPCRRCGGRLMLNVDAGTQQRWEECPTCGGSGDIGTWDSPRRCTRCAGGGKITRDVAATQNVPCPCRTGVTPCSTCGGNKQVHCATCTGSGRTKCDRCRGAKNLVRFATLCRTFESWSRAATCVGGGSDPEVADLLVRRNTFSPLVRLLTAGPNDAADLGPIKAADTTRSLLTAVRTDTTESRRPGCLALEVRRTPAVRIEYDCGGRHVAWLLGRERSVHAPASPVTDALAEKLRIAAKEWRKERKKEAVALVREAVAMGEKDVFCRVALDAERSKLPADLWKAATDPGVLGAVAEGIGKLFGKWFG